MARSWQYQYNPVLYKGSELVIEFFVQYGMEMVCTILSACVIWLFRQASAYRAGMRALLRDRIIDRCNHYLAHGQIPVYGMENIENMYAAYAAIGGNGAAKKLVEEVRDLPTRS